MGDPRDGSAEAPTRADVKLLLGIISDLDGVIRSTAARYEQDGAEAAIALLIDGMGAFDMHPPVYPRAADREVPDA